MAALVLARHFRQLALTVLAPTQPHRAGKGKQLATTPDKPQTKRKRKRETPAGSSEDAPAAAARASKRPQLQQQEEEELGCFCDTDRHLLANDIPFEGAWVACDGCDRWCHGECAGFTLEGAEAVENYMCPLCVAKSETGEGVIAEDDEEERSNGAGPSSSTMTHPLWSFVADSAPSPRATRLAEAPVCSICLDGFDGASLGR